MPEFMSLMLCILQKEHKNMFDALPCLAAPKPDELRDELARYLSTDPEQVEDVLLWWSERRASFPCLSRIALDYLTIPGAFSLPFGEGKS
jgi:hypothetical protein